jgi:5-methylcytosine-specific restriction enzyme subunit McrC
LNPRAADFGVDEADVYQLLAYALRYGCTSLELAHPRPVTTESFPAPPAFKLQVAGQAGDITITVKLVPLWSLLQSEHELQTADFDQAEAA